MIPHRATAILASVAAACCVAGCADDPRSGYALASPYREDVRTVAVPMFENNTYVPNVEAELTEAIIKEIHRSTPWRVVGEGPADTILTGAVQGADLAVMNKNADSGLVQELARRVSVSFEWRRAATGEVLVSRARFTAAETFVPALGAGERLEEGQRQAVAELARQIVGELRSSW